MIDPDHAKRLRQRIETMNKLRGRPLTDVERLANLRRAFDEEDAMDKEHAKRVLEHMRETPRVVMARALAAQIVPSPKYLLIADRVIEALVKAGYAIEPIKDDDEWT